MKKTLYILFTLSINVITAQNWKYNIDENPFDGTYKTAFIKGKAINYPYNKPTLAVNLFNNKSLNFYITNSGYYPNKEIEILWSFDNKKNEIFKTIDLSVSNDGKTFFLEKFKSIKRNEEIAKIIFINLLKSASKVDVRINNNYSKNDMTFTLKGSAKAIDFVINKKFREVEIKKAEKLKKLKDEKLKKLSDKNKANKETNTKVNRYIYSLINKQKITNKTDVRNILKGIKNKSLNINTISNLILIPTIINNSSIDIIILNKKGDQLSTIRNVELIDKDFITNFKKTEFEYFNSKIINNNLTKKNKDLLFKDLISKIKSNSDYNRITEVKRINFKKLIKGKSGINYKQYNYEIIMNDDKIIYCFFKVFDTVSIRSNDNELKMKKNHSNIQKNKFSNPIPIIY